MSYKIAWIPLAEKSYFEEMAFIYFKWNLNQVIDFKTLVESNLFRLSVNPFIGKVSNRLGVYSLKISRQTTLYYRVKQEEKIIELFLFWNNLRNPLELKRLLLT